MAHKPIMLATSGTSQSFEDKLYALKYLISGQGISFVVLKATTSELIGPKKKHLSYLLSMTNEPNVSVPSIVKHLVTRCKHKDWPVVFKCLITMHHLITHGNEKFIHNVASSIANMKSVESLCTFNDQTTSLAFNMSIFIRRYARYLKIRIHTYRRLGIDFCRTSTQVKMRETCHEQLMRIIPFIQEQFDTLLSFDASLNDLSNGIINSAFSMLYKDFVKLYIAYQATIIRLLELYFGTDSLKEANEMLGLYKKFLVRMDKVSDYTPVIDSVGIDKCDMPSFSRVPNLPLKMLERHVQGLASAHKTNHECSLGRVEYDTLRRSRRRSIKTMGRQTSIDILSPMAVMNYKKRDEELKNLNRMLKPNYTRTSGINFGITNYNILETKEEQHDHHSIRARTDETLLGANSSDANDTSNLINTELIIQNNDQTKDSDSHTSARSPFLLHDS